MKLISQTKGASSSEVCLVVVAQDKEDLFTLYNIINTDDELIFKKKLTLKLDEAGKKKSTELVKLRVKVVSSEFEPQHEFLKYKGITTEDDAGKANVDVALGKFFSFTVDYQYPFTIIKKDFNSYCQRLINEACNLESRSDMAAVVLQEGLAHICLLSSFSTILKQKVEYSLPKKKRSVDILKFDEKTEKFYKAIYVAMLKHFNLSQLKAVILCSPGFYAKTLYEKVLQYAQANQDKVIIDNKDKFLVAHCSTGYLQGISEVLRDPAYSQKLQDTKNSSQLQVMDAFLKHLNDDDNKSWYGEAEITKACEFGAIETLLITDDWLRADSVSVRNKSLQLIKDVENMGGNVCVFSSMHPSGEELNSLTGLACILKYPIPDLDEHEDEE
ncbi:AaceriAAL001Wp [[Ashbya] aceris (nom. inval.)]|nr:AaceriAAL001Wp [[Ashbya] aceris (nom. inval.)]